MRTKEKKENELSQDDPVVLDIPEDEIWSYQVEGLAPPHINKPYKHYTLKKIIFAITIIIAVSLSCYFSIRTVQKDVFEYDDTSNGTYQLSKFSNTGYITELNIDYVTSIEYDENNDNPETNFKLVEDMTKRVTEIREYALNCDNNVKVIRIGAEVSEIDGKAFYSCWALQKIEVDENNPYYCDVDGVLYSKDKKEIICCPCDRDAYLCEKYGYSQYDEKGDWKEPEGEEYEKYRKDVMTYIVPSTVEKIGELAFNYAYLTDVYLPESLKTIETLGFFKATSLENVYSYKGENFGGRFTSQDEFDEVYLSFPDGLEYIGSDAFSYNQSMSYVYIPKSVKYIGHHAFWNTVYKENGELKGVSVINVRLSKEEFSEKTETGDWWKPQYDYMLFKKSIDVEYSSQREKQ